MEEKILKSKRGGLYLILTILVHLSSLVLFGHGVARASRGESMGGFFIALAILIFISCFIVYAGFKVIGPQEALVLTLFGKYVGTLKENGIHFVNPFASSINPAKDTRLGQSGDIDSKSSKKILINNEVVNVSNRSNKISLKVMTLSNNKQKINDRLGNPIEIGIAVMWRVVDTAKAVFEVDNYKEYLSLQCDSALREVVRTYPYDVAEGIDTTGDGIADDGSLRGSSDLVAKEIKDRIQEKVSFAGIEIVDARITYLAYAPEIAQAMLQRQQATAVVDARATIVEGAVGMVEMAIDMLNEKSVVELDEERKAQMVSNLMVVLCGNKDAQPILNSGSLY